MPERKMHTSAKFKGLANGGSHIVGHFQTFKRVLSILSHREKGGHHFDVISFSALVAFETLVTWGIPLRIVDSHYSSSSKL